MGISFQLRTGFDLGPHSGLSIASLKTILLAPPARLICGQLHNSLCFLRQTFSHAFPNNCPILYRGIKLRLLTFCNPDNEKNELPSTTHSTFEIPPAGEFFDSHGIYQHPSPNDALRQKPLSF